MTAVRRLLPLAILGVLAAACGGGSAKPAGLSSTATTAAGSARFTLTIHATVAGASIRTDENGTVSFARRQAHVYRLLPAGGVPQELIFDGPLAYSNANVQTAAMDPTVKPWVRSRLGPGAVDDVDHVRAVAYLAGATVNARRVAGRHWRAQVDPNRFSGTLRRVVRADFVAGLFPADFWLDGRGRVVRVHVAYRTSRGGRVVVDGTFSDFGTAVDVTPPPADEIANAAR
jgi:hypothetical protein